jgi:hypothetical protein
MSEHSCCVAVRDDATLILATIILGAGRKYAKHEGYWFCFFLAVFTCLNFPLGAALRVFAIVVLDRPSVKSAFPEASDRGNTGSAYSVSTP